MIYIVKQARLKREVLENRELELSLRLPEKETWIRFGCLGLCETKLYSGSPSSQLDRRSVTYYSPVWWA